MKYRFLAVLVCVLLSGTIATSVACDRSHDDSTPTSSQPYEIKVQYIEASSDYEYGVKAGRMYAGMIKLLPSILPDQLANMGMPSLSPDHIEYVKTYYPEYLERMKGVQRATAVPPQDLMLIGAAIGSYAGCTTSASSPPATLNDDVILTWNCDLPISTKILLKDISSSPEVDAPVLFGKPLLYIRDITGHNKVFCIGIPGVLELPLINDKGLAFVGNAVSMKDDGPGLSDIEILNAVMDRSSTVEEAAELIKNSPRFTSDKASLCNLNYLFADANGGIASIEATNKYFAVKYGKETNGILAQANHHQWLDFRKTGAPNANPQPYGYRSSWIRARRMWDLLEENSGKIDLDTAMGFTRDTANGPEPGRGGYYSICRYGSRDAEEKIPDAPSLYKEDSTILAFVIQPRERVVWYCGAHPDEAPYIKIDLSEHFGKDTEKIKVQEHVMMFTPPQMPPLEEVPKEKVEKREEGISLPPIIGKIAQLPLCASSFLNISCSYCCPFDPTPCLRPIIRQLFSQR